MNLLPQAPQLGSVRHLRNVVSQRKALSETTLVLSLLCVSSQQSLSVGALSFTFSMCVHALEGYHPMCAVMIWERKENRLEQICSTGNMNLLIVGCLTYFLYV